MDKKESQKCYQVLRSVLFQELKKRCKAVKNIDITVKHTDVLRASPKWIDAMIYSAMVCDMLRTVEEFYPDMIKPDMIKFCGENSSSCFSCIPSKKLVDMIALIDEQSGRDSEFRRYKSFADLKRGGGCGGGGPA